MIGSRAIEPFDPFAMMIGLHAREYRWRTNYTSARTIRLPVLEKKGGQPVQLADRYARRALTRA